jgi:hypothetical protein
VVEFHRQELPQQEGRSLRGRGGVGSPPLFFIPICVMFFIYLLEDGQMCNDFGTPTSLHISYK